MILIYTLVYIINFNCAVINAVFNRYRVYFWSTVTFGIRIGIFGVRIYFSIEIKIYFVIVTKWNYYKLLNYIFN